ncbi:MAG TPA: UDP-N-acetylmuramate dehydrogenase [Nitrospirota bacterium]|nr:UDP-N-acetylmuramate dehydrogenase [Nitrospirota bacterium]
MEITGFKGEIKRHEPMSRHTSYAIGGPADVFAIPVDRNDLATLLQEIREKKLKCFVLGGGTNLLVRDGGFRGIVISLQRMQAMKIEREYRSIGGAFTVVFVEAGVPLQKLLSFCVKEGLTGLEFITGIPGTVGGAVCMNAGTTVGEFGDVVDSVTLLSPEGNMVTRGREEMKFGYRTSAIPEGHAILDVRIILRRGDRNKIQEQVREILGTRKQWQPVGLPNAGSVFRNPQEESAGKLIEAAGLKGTSVGSAQVSEKHANFIVNRGNAKASEVLALMEIVKQKVLQIHGVRLEPEIKIIGED